MHWSVMRVLTMREIYKYLKSSSTHPSWYCDFFSSPRVSQYEASHLNRIQENSLSYSLSNNYISCMLATILGMGKKKGWNVLTLQWLLTNNQRDKSWRWACPMVMWVHGAAGWSKRGWMASLCAMSPKTLLLSWCWKDKHHFLRQASWERASGTGTPKQRLKSKKTMIIL